MLIRSFIACSADIKIKLFQSSCCNLYCAQLWYNSNTAPVAKICAGYNKDLHRLILYKLDSFQYGEMLVVNNADSLDVLIRKSLHGFYTCLVKCNKCIIKCLSECFLLYVSPYMKRYIDSVYSFP